MASLGSYNHRSQTVLDPIRPVSAKTSHQIYSIAKTNVHLGYTSLTRTPKNIARQISQSSKPPFDQNSSYALKPCSARLLPSHNKYCSKPAFHKSHRAVSHATNLALQEKSEHHLSFLLFDFLPVGVFGKLYRTVGCHLHIPYPSVKHLSDQFAVGL